MVERRVQVRIPLEPTRRDWLTLLGELAGQLNDGRLYDRDLPGLARALEPVLEAYRRRAHRTGARAVHDVAISSTSPVPGRKPEVPVGG